MPKQVISNEDDQRRAKVSQLEFPNTSLQQALRIARGIWEDFAGKDAAPHQVAMSIGLSPTSGGWRNLCGASIGFGLTEGGYNADRITLTDLGRRIVAPQEEGDDAKALGEAILQPRIMREFFQKYDKAKFPKDEIAQNVLVGMGLPKERAPQALEILKNAGEIAGVIVETKTGPFVALGAQIARPRGDTQGVDGGERESGSTSPPKLDVVTPGIPNIGAGSVASATATTTKTGPSRVFITHGKNHKILEQVKEIVTYGKFLPVVAKDVETVSKPLPQKVMEEMRGCDAAVIHVGIDERLINDKGEQVPRINENVLIEIGAAMALYKENFVLLVEDGVTLPSNLQGLYQCRYSGNELGMTATMKLLKAFNDFKFETGK